MFEKALKERMAGKLPAEVIVNITLKPEDRQRLWKILTDVEENDFWNEIANLESGETEAKDKNKSRSS